MKKTLQIFSLVSLLSLVGCAGIEPPSPEKILAHPLGTSPIHLGMTKDQVREILGEPDSVQDDTGTRDKLTTKQEWVYYRRMQNLPVNYGYLSKSLHLTFDGNSVTSVTEE